MQIPKVGSYVLAVARIEDDNDWMIIACDEVDKFIWNTSNAQIQIDDKIHLEAGGESLLNLLENLFQIIEKGL